MRKKDRMKNDLLYKLYCKVEDNYERKWEKEEFNSFILNQYNIFILSYPQPVGYIKARIVKDEIEIIALLTDKKYRKKGIGKELLNKLLNIANKKNIQRIFLEVSVENEIAIGLYKKFNFTNVGHRKGYYNINGKKLDANIMRLDLV